MNVYLEHDDRHNPPIVMTFESEEEAMRYVLRYCSDAYEQGHAKEAQLELFDPEDGSGEHNTGSDLFTLVTEDLARERSSYWDSVAEAIRFGKKAP